MTVHSWIHAPRGGHRAKCLVALFLAVVLGACSDSPTVSERIEKARAFQSEGDLRGAVIELKNVLQKQPDNAEVRHMLGRIYVHMDRMAEAEKELSRAKNLGRDPEAVTLWLGRALLGQGENKRVLSEITAAPHWSQETRAVIAALRARAAAALGANGTATELLDQAQSLGPELLETYIARVEVALQVTEIERARAVAEEMVAAYPADGRAWQLRARIALIDGDLELAEEALSEAINRQFSSRLELMQRAQVRLNRGNIEGARRDVEALRDQASADHPSVLFISALVDWEAGQHEKACERLAEAVGRAPKFTVARVYLAACQYRNKTYNRAVGTLREIPVPERDDTVLRLLAASYLEIGEMEAARTVIAPVVERNPEDAAALSLLARAELALGNTQAGLRNLERLSALRPDDPSVSLQLGVGLLKSGNLDEGRMALDKTLRIRPGQREAGTLLVLGHLEAGDHERALDVARKLAEQRPQAPLPLTLQGVAHRARGDRGAAREAFAAALELDPADPAARHQLAQMAREAGDLEAARGHYESVLEKQPGHVGTLLALARLETELGRMEQTEARLREAVAANADLVGPRVLLGRLLLRKGQAEVVLEVLQGPEGGIPAVPEALEVAARAQLNTGQPSKAVAYLKRLVEMRPEDAESRVLLARAHGESGNTDAFKEQIERAAAIDPDASGVRTLLARMRIREGRPDEADRLLEALPDEVSDHPWVLDTKAELALSRGEYQEAIDIYKRVLREAASSRVVVNLSQAYRLIDDPDSAREVLENWLAEHEDAVIPRMALGNLHFRAGRRADAIGAYREVLRHQPNHVLAMNNLAWLLREQSPDEAERLAEKAVELSGRSAGVLDTLGVILLSKGDTEHAVELFREAADADPDLLDARYHLAQGLAKLGERAEARRVLSAALDAQGTFTERDAARILLERLGGES